MDQILWCYHSTKPVQQDFDIILFIKPRSLESVLSLDNLCFHFYQSHYSSSILLVPIYTPGQRESGWSNVPCLRKQRDGRGLNLELRILKFKFGGVNRLVSDGHAFRYGCRQIKLISESFSVNFFQIPGWFINKNGAFHYLGFPGIGHLASGALWM